MRKLQRAGAAALAALALAACGNFKGPLLPLEEARYRLPKAITTDGVVRLTPQPPPAFPEAPVQVAGARWIVTATTYSLPADLVAPVATADGMMFRALAWDEQPFDGLLVARLGLPGVDQEFLEVY